MGRTARRAGVAVAATLALGGGAASASASSLPSVRVAATTVALTHGTHSGPTVSAGCDAGTLVGGGAYLRNAADPLVIPTNGLVLGGVAPSTGAAPVDLPAGDGAPTPRDWMSIARYTGASEAGNQASAFALCATGGPATTIVATASTTGVNATQQTSPPTPTTATCAHGTRLIGGGVVTQAPGQVNDGVTAGGGGNLKPLASYPSDAGGVPAADGSTSATSWTGYGSAGVPSAGDVVTAFALCTAEPIEPVRVARVDVTLPGSIGIAAPRCPPRTRLLGGGYKADQTTDGVGGLQPQQGYHMRGSYPSQAPGGTPAEVADGSADPDTWTALLQAGGQTLSAGRSMQLHGFALCATAAPAAPAATTGAASALADDGATLAGSVDPNGEPAASVFEYGPTLAFGSITTPDAAGAGDEPVAVAATLTGLPARTTIFYRLVATNATGTTFGAVRSFATTGTPQPPTAITLDATAIGPTSAAIAGAVDPAGQQTAFTVEYGTTTAFGAIGDVVALDDAHALEPVATTLGGLAPATTYRYRVVATNATGTSFGSVRSFTTAPSPPDPGAGGSVVAAGFAHSCALRVGGQVACWGAGGFGQLGSGTTAGSPTPVAVAGLADAVEISAGTQLACARRAAGTVACWGNNGAGQLGDGTLVNAAAPVAVAGIADAVQVSAGSTHSCAVRGAGAVACWGRNDNGKLGDGTTANSPAPVAVSGLADAVQVAAGNFHSCALRRGGQVACWGANTFGQLGTGTGAASSTPAAVSALSDAIAVAAANQHTCALRRGGQVACWGNNALGRLGDGTSANSGVPVAVADLTDAIQIATLNNHSCALRASGRVACWGANAAGQLGDGTAANANRPVAVAGIAGASQIGAGANHTCASPSAGRVACWGANDGGQLGDGTLTASPLPVPVSALADAGRPPTA